ncbi:MAG: hypothetical protein M1827_006631 [Pycnora praestabilis]|nr:MAG: hypothetical protein M1827_006631 [Pycnora praestabilis]
MTTNTPINQYQLQALRLSQSPPSGADKLYQLAVEGFRDQFKTGEISFEQLDLITSRGSLHELQQDVENAKKQSRIRKHGGSAMFTRGSRFSLSTLERFSDAIDIMVSSNPEISALVWGSVRFLLVVGDVTPSEMKRTLMNALEVARDIFDTFERLTTLSTRIGHCLERFSEYMTIFELRGLFRDRLVLFYQGIISFCLEAAKAYNRGKARTFGAAVWSSIKQPFENLLQKLTYYADEVDKAAVMEHMKDARNQKVLHQIQQSPAVSSRQSGTSVSRNFSVPALLSNYFTGRQVILQGLQINLVDSNDRISPRRAALWGLPGIGKSQIALQYAAITQARYTNVFFIHSGSEAQLMSDYRIIADLLELFPLHDREIEERRVIERVKHWLANNTGWLLIYDNVGDLSALRQCLPSAGTGDLLFTMRDIVAATSLSDTDCTFEVKPLDPPNAVELVCRTLHVNGPNEALKGTAEELCYLLAGLPIAIEQSVTLARMQKVPLSTILQQLKNRRQSIMDQGYPTSLHESQVSTSALFAIASDNLQRNSPQAAALFRIMIYLETSAIPIELLKSGAAKLSFYQNRVTEYDRGTDRSQKEEELRIAERIKSQLEKNQSRSSLLQTLHWNRKNHNEVKNAGPLRLVESDVETSLAQHTADIQHVLDVLEAPNRIENALLDLQNAGLIRRNSPTTLWIHDLIRDLTIETLSTRCVTTKGNAQVNPLTALTLVYLAFPIPERALAYTTCLLYQPHAFSVLFHCSHFIFDTVIGPEMMHITASTLSLTRLPNTGSFQQDAKYWYYYAYTAYKTNWQRLLRHHTPYRIAQAARSDFDLELRGAVFDRVVGGYERFGQAPQRALDTALKLGYVFAVEHDWAEARRWVGVAVEGYRWLLGEDHEMTFNAIGFLVHVFMEMGELEQALTLALRRIGIYERRWGALDQCLIGASCARDVSSIYEKSGNLQLAVEYQQQCLTGQSTIDGPSSSTLAPTLINLARLHRQMQQHQTAVELSTRALALGVHDEWISNDSLALNEARCDLAISLCHPQISRGEEAIELWRTALIALVGNYDGTWEKVPDLEKQALWKIVWCVIQYASSNPSAPPDIIEEDTEFHPNLELDETMMAHVVKLLNGSEAGARAGREAGEQSLWDILMFAQASWMAETGYQRRTGRQDDQDK